MTSLVALPPAVDARTRAWKEVLRSRRTRDHAAASTPPSATMPVTCRLLLASRASILEGGGSRVDGSRSREPWRPVPVNASLVQTPALRHWKHARSSSRHQINLPVFLARARSK